MHLRHLRRLPNYGLEDDRSYWQLQFYYSHHHSAPHLFLRFRQSNYLPLLLVPLTDEEKAAECREVVNQYIEAGFQRGVNF